MFKKIRTSRYTKIFTSYLTIQFLLTIIQPAKLFALTGGPSQPEFNSFTPIGTSDMVNLSSGDFNYNIPIMDVGGYPLNLSYDSGITMDQEASWVGLGWNLNVGQINRAVRGLPDDFDGDKMTYENNFKPNITVGTHFNLGASAFGLKELDVTGEVGFGLGVQFNNYTGISFKPSIGVSFNLSEGANIGMNLSGSVEEGPTISPSVSLTRMAEAEEIESITGGIGASINSRQGLLSVNVNSSMKRSVLTQILNPHLMKEESGSFGFSFNNDVLFTPTKRTSTISNNITFNATVGGTFFGINVDGKVNGYGYTQRISKADKEKEVTSYGYEYTENNEAANEGVLDFNREKDREFTKNTTLLPITNYTYDMYSIQGQGIGGSFRPYRSQVGYLGDNFVENKGSGGSFGVEARFGNAFAAGVDIETTKTRSSTGLWKKESKNNAIDNFTNSSDSENELDYEKVYFRNVGELNVDNENEDSGLFQQKLGGSNAIRLQLDGGRYDRSLTNIYSEKYNNSSERALSTIGSTNKFKRENRLLRNQSIQKVKVEDVIKSVGVTTTSINPFFEINEYAINKPKHTAGFSILKPDGSNYIYGKTAYNIIKREATFAVKGGATVDNLGLIDYSRNNNSTRNSDGVDGFFNRNTTPAYAHTYLLTSVLSSDYEDLRGDGPSDDDLGSYTKFEYTESKENYPNGFKWRVPFQENKATANKGLYSHDNDQKGNYIYGEREQVYIQKIETKTHVAIFNLTDREDGYGVKGENGGIDTSLKTKKIESIELFSKTDYYSDVNNSVINENATPIKTAHFEYNYSLCQDIPNSLNGQGKLTLEKVYFTYRDSNMGRYTPYVFNYGEIDLNGNGIIEENEISNPKYNLKENDIWGNYKENTNDGNLLVQGYSTDLDKEPTTSEFPYVSQESQDVVDKNTVAWTLTSINLPSGGTLEITFESDDYQFVQDKKAMQMFSVHGVGSNAIPSEADVDISINSRKYLYDGSSDKKYLYVKVANNYSLKESYLEGLKDEPIYFKFLVNMTKDPKQFDYVSGYFNIDQDRYDDITTTELGGNTYLSLPMKFLRLDGKKKQRKVNPISKAGWYFGRQNMNRIVYGGGDATVNPNMVEIINELANSIKSVLEVAKGPNKVLRDKKVANKFKPKKSWIRLLNPKKKKFGGGSRVKTIKMNDNWSSMADAGIDSNKFYGQEYDYRDIQNYSSGVATFEPNSSKENPFVCPIYNKSESGRDKLLAPKESNFVEKPIGESFFPSPTVTYSRVTVSNLSHPDISRHATGKVVNSFYTTHDFPTLTDYTELNAESFNFDKAKGISNLLKFSVRNHMTASQGFVIEKNDMNGKEKSQWVYAENNEAPISGVAYNYYTNDDGSLKNNLTVIDETGEISYKNIGVNYDVINDFRESKSTTTTVGVDTNVAGFFAFIWPVIVPVPLPSYAKHENILRTATTTKVVEKHGILKEKIAYDLGAQVSTKNIAWDANTGQVLVTETINEFDDNYYSINYPAYWKHDNMGQASRNLDIEGYLNTYNDNEEGDFEIYKNIELQGTDNYSLIGRVNNNRLFSPGDMLQTYYDIGDGVKGQEEVLWVSEVSVRDNRTLIKLMDRNGQTVLNKECALKQKDTEFFALKFKLIRSAHKNLQSASMASVTSKTNPIPTDINDKLLNVNNVVNASAIKYSEYWLPQDQLGLPRLTQNVINTFNNPEVGASLPSTAYGFNPYLYNVIGEFRAEESYAYLTNRTSSISVNSNNENNNPTIKSDGYFETFTPFYNYSNGGWQINTTDQNWTTASTVTQYSPYGTELENRDALGRHSSAIYGYGYTLPTAVASNSKYNEIAFDGFEDYTDKEKLKQTSAVVKDVSFANDQTVVDYFTRDHFSFNYLTKETENNGALEQGTAHTGRASYKVTGDRVATVKGLTPYNYHLKDEPDCSGETDEPRIINDIQATLEVQEDIMSCGQNERIISFKFENKGELPETIWMLFDYELPASRYLLTDKSAEVIFDAFFEVKNKITDETIAEDGNYGYNIDENLSKNIKSDNFIKQFNIQSGEVIEIEFDFTLVSYFSDSRQDPCVSKRDDEDGPCNEDDFLYFSCFFKDKYGNEIINIEPTDVPGAINRIPSYECK